MKKREASEYGKYEEMFGDKVFLRAVKILDRTARQFGVDYAVLGGSAVYLHTHNPPEDFADLDILLDSNKELAVLFVKNLERRGFTRKLLDVSLPDDMFAIVKYGKHQIDLFTDQSERGGKSEYRRMLRVRSVPELLVEKLIRATREDLLMAIDLINCPKHDEAEFIKAVRGRNLGMLYVKVRFLAEGFRTGKISKAMVSIMVSRLARGEEG